MEILLLAALCAVGWLCAEWMRSPSLGHEQPLPPPSQTETDLKAMTEALDQAVAAENGRAALRAKWAAEAHKATPIRSAERTDTEHMHNNWD